MTANSDPTNTFSVLLNRGDGTYRAKLDYRTGDNPESVAIGDLNADGRPTSTAPPGVSRLTHVSRSPSRSGRSWATPPATRRASSTETATNPGG